MTNNHHNEAELQKYWIEQSMILDKIKERGGMEEYVKNIPDLKKAFMPENASVSCMDEGTPYGMVRFAGSGILLKERKAELVTRLKEIGVDGVYSHMGCGAAKLYAKNNNLDLDKADTYGREWAESLAEELKVSYKGHIGAPLALPMKRPAEFHIARVIYYDGTGVFNPDKAQELPAGFVVSRRYHLEVNDALDEIKIAISIATGDHGFGNLIDKAHPIRLVVISDSENSGFSEEKLKGEVEEVAKSFEGKILIDFLRVPVAVTQSV